MLRLRPAARRRLPVALISTSLVACFGLTAPLPPASAEPSRSLTVKTGELLDVSVPGCPPRSQFRAYFGATEVPIAAVNTFDGDTASGRLVVPDQVLPGPTRLVLVDSTTGLSCEEQVTVATDWSQRGFGTAGTGYNPSQQLVGPAAAGSLRQRWSVPLSTGSGSDPLTEPTVSTQPVIGGILTTIRGSTMYALHTADGSQLARTPLPGSGADVSLGRYGDAYVLTSAGRIQRQSLVSPDPAWSQDLGLGSQVQPVAVRYEASTTSDGKPGVVVAANKDGAGVIAAYTEDGRLLWSRATSSTLTGLVVDDSFAYAGTASGKAIRLVLYNGAIGWTTQTAARRLGAPALDDGVLVFGSGTDGARSAPTGPVGLLALRADTGQTLWSYDTDYGRGTATRPAIHAGVVTVGFLGSGSSATARAVRAFTLSTGAVRWSAAVSTASRTTAWTDPTSAGGVVYLSSCGPDGSLLALAESDGTRLRDDPLHPCAQPIPVNERVYLNSPDGVAALGLPTEVSPLAVVDDNVVGTGVEQLSFGGGWRLGHTNHEYGGGDHYSAVPGSTVTMRFTGVGARYWYSISPARGIAEVRIDNGPVTRIDQYAALASAGDVSWTTPGLSRGPHTISIRVSGMHRSASTSSTVTVDRIDIGH